MDELMSFIPAGNRILIKAPAPKEAQTKSGIILPQNVSEKSLRKMAVGDVSGIDQVDNPNIKIGTKVVYDPSNAYEITIAETRYHLVDEPDILGIAAPAPADKAK